MRSTAASDLHGRYDRSFTSDGALPSLSLLQHLRWPMTPARFTDRQDRRTFLKAVAASGAAFAALGCATGGNNTVPVRVSPSTRTASGIPAGPGNPTGVH